MMVVWVSSFCSPFSSKAVVYGLCFVTLPCIVTATLKWLSSLPVIMLESFWWWRCSIRCSLPFPPTSWDPGPHQYLSGDILALNKSNEWTVINHWMFFSTFPVKRGLPTHVCPGRRVAHVCPGCRLNSDTCPTDCTKGSATNTWGDKWALPAPPHPPHPPRGGWVGGWGDAAREQQPCSGHWGSILISCGQLGMKY